jgi:metallo-beta-lactamase family protein
MQSITIRKRAKRGEETNRNRFTLLRMQKTVFPHFELVNYHEVKELAEGVQFHFTDVGHILGSAAVHLTITEKWQGAPDYF